MVKNIILLVLVFFTFSTSAFQNADSSKYYEYLYYTCKIWGYTKYFHSELAKGNIDWDQQLLTSIDKINSSEKTDGNFNDIIVEMITAAGENEIGIGEKPQVEDELKYNLNTSWFNDILLGTECQEILHNIEENFRPRSNYYVGVGASPVFNSDDAYFDFYSDQLPPENFRLLAMFKYWNMINYFFAYKNIMDKDWDDVLKEYIPQIINSQTKEEYLQTFAMLVAEIDDSHGTFSHIFYDQSLRGHYCFPFTLKYVEDNYIIFSVFDQEDQLQVGDILLEIDGKSVFAIEDSLRKFIAASNESICKHKTAQLLRYGHQKDVELKIKRGNETFVVSINRGIQRFGPLDVVDHNIYHYDQRPSWKIFNKDDHSYGNVDLQVLAEGEEIGYMDLGVLKPEDVQKAFMELWWSKGIIIDVRNYPSGTMWSMVAWLFEDPVVHSLLQVSNVEYPGTYSWQDFMVYPEGFGLPYDKPIYILFDEQTISHAEFSVMTFEQHPKAVKIGSQTAAADGNICIVKLPGGITSSFTGMGVFYPDGSPTQRIGIVPDYEVKPTIEGIRAGRDELVEFAMSHLIDSYTGIGKDQNNYPTEFNLSQNFPNPFNPSTTIKISLPESGLVSVRIYDILGQEVRTIVNEVLYSGIHRFVWNGDNEEGDKMTSGIYFYRVETEVNSITKKMLLLK